MSAVAGSYHAAASEPRLKGLTSGTDGPFAILGDDQITALSVRSAEMPLWFELSKTFSRNCAAAGKNEHNRSENKIAGHRFHYMLCGPGPRSDILKVRIQGREALPLKRTLGLRDLVLTGIILVQPTAPMPLFGVVQQKAQGHVVTTILIAMVAMMFTALSYGRMARAIPAPGRLTLTSVRRSIPHWGTPLVGAC